MGLSLLRKADDRVIRVEQMGQSKQEACKSLEMLAPRLPRTEQDAWGSFWKAEGVDPRRFPSLRIKCHHCYFDRYFTRWMIKYSEQPL